jgi:drug/metabolite transporter (DMT)-like permease
VGVLALSLAACALLYLPIAAFSWPTGIPSVSVLGSIAILAVVCTTGGFIVFAALIAEIGPVRSTVITYVNPAVAVLFGVLVLGERLGTASIAGLALILAGSWVSTRARREEPEGAGRPRPEGEFRAAPLLRKRAGR